MRRIIDPGGWLRDVLGAANDSRAFTAGIGARGAPRRGTYVFFGRGKSLSPGTGEFISAVAEAQHPSVVAWTLGVPAFCFCGPVSRSPSSVNSGKRFAWRDKRDVFFSQYDEVSDQLAQQIRRLVG